MKGLYQRFRLAYADAGRDITSRVDSLFVAHILLMAGLVLVGGIFALEGEQYRLIFAVVLMAVYGFSLWAGFQGKYSLSSSLISLGGFAFMAVTGTLSALESTDPHVVHMLTVYTIAPCIMATLLSVRMTIPYILAFSAALVVNLLFFLHVVPSNPDQSLVHLLAKYLIFDLLLMVFMAHFIMKKHRIAHRLLEEADHFSRTSDDNNRRISELLGEVRNAMGITSQLGEAMTLIRSQIAEAHQRQESIGSQARELGLGFGALEGQMSSIAQDLEKLAQAAEIQARAQEESAGATTEMSASIQNVAEIVDRKTGSARKLLDSASAGSEQLEGAMELMRQLSDHAAAVQDLTGIIDHIARQTNLLSMNAAIEAAHAGAAGKGFAVVAEEIRKLAESSAENAGNISAVLQDMVDSASKGVESTHRTNEVFGAVLKDVRETVQALDEIRSSTVELGEGSREIQKSMETLKNLGSSLRESSQGINDSQARMRERLRVMGQGLETVQSDLGTLAKANHLINESLNLLGSILNRLQQTNEALAQGDA